jgi:hypothetical protein
MVVVFILKHCFSYVFTVWVRLFKMPSPEGPDACARVVEHSAVFMICSSAAAWTLASPGDLLSLRTKCSRACGASSALSAASPSTACPSLNPVDAPTNLVLRSALLRASRRTATSKTEPAAILRDARRAKPRAELLRMRPSRRRLLGMRSVGFKLRPPHPIGFMESIS